ncbi:hypothetical protein FWH09_01540 [Candidatus Saccharibacteria bacterium]|nr:hypothetical protein [Candidatus Saccharibacteria bacterium]
MFFSLATGDSRVLAGASVGGVVWGCARCGVVGGEGLLVGVVGGEGLLVGVVGGEGLLVEKNRPKRAVV